VLTRGGLELVAWLEERPKYAFAAHATLLGLPTALRRQHGLRTLTLHLPTTHTCLGPWPRRQLYEHVLGYDAPLGHSALAVSGGRGQPERLPPHDGAPGSCV
jgi:hypothetical protein